MTAPSGRPIVTAPAEAVRGEDGHGDAEPDEFVRGEVGRAAPQRQFGSAVRVLAPWSPARVRATRAVTAPRAK
ncbi:hypothetical protein [Streptomyces sp. NPDC048663]|uniref:hypothetical protein n=1 Tax=Streptomyces sp. NPDC048663 TaxID=3155638 RepID=UPI00342E482A